MKITILFLVLLLSISHIRAEKSKENRRFLQQHPTPTNPETDPLS